MYVKHLPLVIWNTCLGDVILVIVLFIIFRDLKLMIIILLYTFNITKLIKLH
jgi:hypothetical protein